MREALSTCGLPAWPVNGLRGGENLRDGAGGRVVVATGSEVTQAWSIAPIIGVLYPLTFAVISMTYRLVAPIVVLVRLVIVSMAGGAGAADQARLTDAHYIHGCGNFPQWTLPRVVQVPLASAKKKKGGPARAHSGLSKQPIFYP